MIEIIWNFDNIFKVQEPMVVRNTDEFWTKTMEISTGWQPNGPLADPKDSMIIVMYNSNSPDL